LSYCKISVFAHALGDFLIGKKSFPVFPDLEDNMTTATQEKDAKLAARGELQAQKQKAYLESLAPDVQEHARCVENLFNDENKRTNQSRHELGTHILAIHDPSNGRAKSYGKKVVDALCEIFD
jgi:hypothetical protein